MNTRDMYWSVRRELWENRSIYVAPLAVAGVLLLAFSIAAMVVLHRGHPVSMPDPVQQRAAIEMPYDYGARMIVLTAFIVGFVYCLDALHGERRDRSILFWKSLPVSDLTTVLSKASIPLLVLPLLTFAVIVVTHLLTLLLSTAVLRMNGLSGATWRQPPLFQLWLVLLYALTALTLWNAPLYAWLLLVSGWARRATLLWAVLPVIAIGVADTIAFNAWPFGPILTYRLSGVFVQSYAANAHGRLGVQSPIQLTPGELLSMPRLWIGLALAAALLAAAVRQRRYRDPI